MRDSGLLSRAGSALAGAIITAAIGLAMTAPAASAALQPPSKDPFYTYSGDLSRIAPGTVLKERTVTISNLLAASEPLPAIQLLFRTTDQIGQPTVAVTTAIEPPNSSGPPKIMSWQTFYDALGSNCDPSYQLQGGGNSFPTAPSDCATDTQAEGTAAQVFLAEGATIVITDYEETNEAYAAGGASGYATLDGIRATEHALKYAPGSTPVAMIGYSGGATASEWASELQTTYAPGIDLVGTAAGGVLASPLQTLKYINGNFSGWADVIPVGLFALQRGFHINIDPYLSPLGQKVMSDDSNVYIGDFDTDFNYMQQLLKPQYANWTHIKVFARALAALNMGSHHTPSTPLFLGNGEGVKANGFDGDGVMVTTAVTALAEKYCSKGVPVEYQEYPGLDHDEAAGPFLAYALPWLAGRLAGAPMVSNCATLATADAPNIYPAGTTCSSSSTCTATWSAAVSGSYYGMTTGSWEVQQAQCTAGDSDCSTWKTIASGGAGPFSSTPGALAAGNIYRLVLTGYGEGVIGTWTGTGPV